MSENIQLNIDEIEEQEEEEEGKKEGILLSELINNIENTILMDNNEKYKEYEESIKVSQMIDYQMNYTVKQLIVICDYYGILKQIKCNKCNKDEIIHILIDFENDGNNEDIVSTRKNMWFYMNELKNDKIMKKYVLW